MSTRKEKRLRITERDFLLANRKAAREEEILAHGKPIAFRSHLYRSKKKYDRKQLKKTITLPDDGFFVSFDSFCTINVPTPSSLALQVIRDMARLS